MSRPPSVLAPGVVRLTDGIEAQFSDACWLSVRGQNKPLHQLDEQDINALRSIAEACANMRSSELLAALVGVLQQRNGGRR